MFVGVSSYLSSRAKTKGTVFTPSQLEVDAKVQTSQLFLQDFSRIMLKHGKKTLEVKAASGKFLPQDSITYLTQAEVKVQRENGKVVCFLFPGSSYHISCNFCRFLQAARFHFF